MRERLGSLAVQLVAIVAVTGLVAGAAGTLAIRDSAQRVLREDVEKERVGVAARLAAVLDARAAGMEQSVQILSSRREVTSLDTAGTELAVTLRSGKAFDSLMLFAADGTAIAGASNRSLINAAHVPARPDVVEGLVPGETRIRTVAAGESAGRDLEIVAPVERPPGTIVGAVVARSPLELVTQDLQAGFRGTTVVAFVADPSGQILAHPERDRVLAAEDYPIEELQQAQGGVDVVERGGRSVLAAAAPTREFAALVVVEQDESEALSRVGREVGELTTLVALVVGVIVLAVLAFGTRVLQPLRSLARTVQRIGQGQPARARVAGSTEIRAVAEEVNRMAESLERRVRDLEAARGELAETEARFRAAFDQGPAAMAVIDAAGRFRQVNPAMRALLGRPEDDFTHLTRQDIFHPDDSVDIERALAAAVAAGQRSYRLETRCVSASGQPIWTLMSVGVVQPGDGDTSTVLHLQDISDQRQAREDREQLLRTALAAEERTTRVLEGAPDATLVVDHQGRIAYANRQTGEMFGHQPVDLIGQHIEILLPERFRSRHEGHRRAYSSHPQSRPMGAGLSLWGRRGDGSEFPVEVSLSPLDVEGETQVVASVRDVTERRRTEQDARTLDAMRTRQRQAVELNDNIVQGLAVAKWAFECERLTEAHQAIERTYQAAQTLIQDMLREASAVEIEAGDLVRQTPAEFGR